MIALNLKRTRAQPGYEQDNAVESAEADDGEVDVGTPADLEDQPGDRGIMGMMPLQSCLRFKFEIQLEVQARAQFYWCVFICGVHGYLLFSMFTIV